MLALISYMTADFAIRVLPARVANGLARTCARVAFAFRPAPRRRLEANLSRLLETPGVRARALESFEHFALTLTDFLRLGHIRRESLPASVEVRGAEHLAAAAASERGVIVLSAHVGSWERGAAFLASLGRHVHIAARPHPSRRVEDFFARRRGSWGVSRLCGRPLWLAASQALRRREWVALMGDRRAPEGGASPCAWAAALSRRTGALVLPAVMLRLADGRHAACFEPPLTPEQCRGGGYREAMRRCLERAPGQWCAFEPLPEGLA